MRVQLILAILAAVAPAAAEDFKLTVDGIGPITFHTSLTYEGKGERLTATAANASGETIPYAKFCVTAAIKDCLFTMWNTAAWAPGASLSWDMTSPHHVRDLSHRVVVYGEQLDSPESNRPAVRAPDPPIKPARQLERGMVISQQLNTSREGVYAAPIGTAAIAIPLYAHSNIVVVDVGNLEYTWSEYGRKTLILVVNAQVEFYRDGRWFIVSDSIGNKHKFALIGAVARE